MQNVTLYVSVRWAIRVEGEQRLGQNENTMLRWMLGVSDGQVPTVELERRLGTARALEVLTSELW